MERREKGWREKDFAGPHRFGRCIRTVHEFSHRFGEGFVSGARARISAWSAARGCSVIRFLTPCREGLVPSSTSGPLSAE